MTQPEPGDLILVKTPGIAFSVARRLVRSRYDHIAVFMGGDETLNIVMPRAVLLPLAVVSKPRNAPLVLRPAWQTLEQRERFITEMRSYLGIEYDTRKALLGVLLTFLGTWLGLRIRLKNRATPTRKSICTEAIVVSLERVMPDLSSVHRRKLDYTVLGFATTNDFLRIAGQSPHLLRIVP